MRNYNRTTDLKTPVAFLAEARCGQLCSSLESSGSVVCSFLVSSGSVIVRSGSVTVGLFSTPSFFSSVSFSSMGYNLVIGLVVIPFAVRMVAARTRLSLPTIKSSTMAIFQVVRGVSSWTMTTSPFFTRRWLFPDALWYSRSEVRYS